MTEKEIAEIRRRLKPDKNNISYIHGCYVNERREIIARVAQQVPLMSEEESDKFFALLRRPLSGKLGKTMVGLSYRTTQVQTSEEHRLLTALRDTGLNEEELREQLYSRIIENLKLDGQYLILIANDIYDVPSKNKFDDELESENVFSYLVCAVCPVKPTKPTLGYDFVEEQFHTLGENWVVGSPKLGFMFPAFDDRTANIYEALYYSSDVAEMHDEFAAAVFNVDETPMAADEQRAVFSEVLAETLDDECSFEVIQTVHDELNRYIEAHNEAKIEDPLRLSKGAVSTLLESCGVSQEKLEAFDRNYDEAFGKNVDIMPSNIIDSKKFEVKTPDVVIQVNPERVDLVETRVIDGMKYILIAADAGVEINGINVSIDDDAKNA